MKLFLPPYDASLYCFPYTSVHHLAFKCFWLLCPIQKTFALIEPNCDVIQIWVPTKNPSVKMPLVSHYKKSFPLKRSDWRSMLWLSRHLLCELSNESIAECRCACCGGPDRRIFTSRGVCLHSLTLVKFPVELDISRITLHLHFLLSSVRSDSFHVSPFARSACIAYRGHTVTPLSKYLPHAG